MLINKRKIEIPYVTHTLYIFSPPYS